MAVPFGLHQAGREFRRRHEFRDVSDVLLFFGALPAVEIARGRLGIDLLRLAGQSLHLCGGALFRFPLYGVWEPLSALVVSGTAVLFFLLAVLGYNPQRGMIRRAVQA